MTRELSLRSLNIPDIHKFAVGFDSIFDELSRMHSQQGNSNYPPYNIVKYNDNQFAIELAVAGFTRGEISVEVEKNLLVIKGEQTPNPDSQVEYLHHGISARNFVRTWTLADHVKVSGAESKDGILTVLLERVVPEEQRPKTIAISYTK